jgi:nicotinamide-nucleotide amidase
MLQPLYWAWAQRQPPIEATILAAAAMLELQLSVKHADGAEGQRLLESAAGQVADVFRADTVSIRGLPLEVVVGELLREQGLRLAVAESCTGGLVASRLTDVPGSSDYLECGVVVYSNRAKTALLAVPATLIAEHGAVSEPVAAAMAAGARRLDADIGLAITGIAGPGGGTQAKPVGTVAIAVDGPGEGRFVRTYLFAGGRETVKLFASTTALDRLRRALLKE